MTAAMIFDESVYTALRDEVGNEDLWKGLLDTFRDELSWRTVAILEHTALGNMDQVETNAHGLKSLANTYGFISLGDACRTLEHASRDSRGFDEALTSYQDAVGEARQHLLMLD